MKKKCVITGGHFTPGLAIAEELKSRNWEVSWIGIENAVSGTKATTLEIKTLPGLGIPFYGITSAKLHRRDMTKSLFFSWQFFQGVYQSFVLLQKLKPDIVLSFGSFVAVPVSFAAWILGIPVVTHEQTTTSGLANMAVAFVAQKVALSFTQSQSKFPKEKTVLTGNLVRKEIYKIAKQRKNKILGKPPLLFITGGSRGSVVLNETVIQALDKLVEKFSIIHQTGEVDFERVKEAKKELPAKVQSRYKIGPTFAPAEFESFFAKADIMLSRSGANTVSEIAILGIPAIFVPISWSAANEQYKNAKLLESLGSAQIIEESELNINKLVSTLEKIVKNYKTYKRNASKAKKLVPENASQKLADILENITREAN